MGDKKPKKKSSGTNAAHKAREAKAQSTKPSDGKDAGKGNDKKK